MATNGCFARGPRSCTALASASLPVPLSPSSRTGTLVEAIFSTSRQTFSIAGLGGDDPLDRRAGRHGGQAAVFLFQPVQVEAAIDDGAQHLDLDGFSQKS